MPTLEIRNKTKAGKRLCRQDSKKINEIKAVVSIGDPGEKPCAGFESFKGPKLRLEFMDTLPKDRWGGEAAADINDIVNLVTFAEKIKTVDGVVLVHCLAGMCRSTAAAFVMQCAWDGPKKEWDALNKVLEATKDEEPWPNEHVVRLGDEVLGRDGIMSWVIDEFASGIAKMY